MDFLHSLHYMIDFRVNDYKTNDDNKNDGAMTKMLSYSSFAVFYGIYIG